VVSTAVVVHDSARGNGNGRLDPNESSDLEVRVLNNGLGHAYNLTGRLVSGDARLTVLDPDAVYGLVRAGQTGSNIGDLLAVNADGTIPPETPVSCTLKLTAAGGYSVDLPFSIVVGLVRQSDPIPDGPRVPALYYAYDEIDLAYQPHPAYNWVEINAVGTRITYSQNDAVVVVSLPTGFGPLKFYGQRYTQVSISADGWLCPGNYTMTDYSNVRLPDASTPPG